MPLHPLRAHWPGSHQSCWRRASGFHTFPARSSCCWSPPLGERRQSRWNRSTDRSREGKREKGVGLGGQRQTVPGSCVIIWFWRLAQGQRAELGWQETLWQLLMTFTFPGAPPLFTHSAASAALRLTAVSPWFTYYCMLLQWWRLIAMTWHLASRDEVRGSVQVFPA